MKSRAAETCALGQYIILIILLPSQFLHCPLDYAHSRLSPSLSSTTCTTTCKHILVKFLREESCISTKARRNAPALGRSSSQHPAAAAFKTVFALVSVELPLRQVALKQGGAICGFHNNHRSEIGKSWTGCSRICTYKTL